MMGRMEQTLKYEIARLAKKQARALCLPLAADLRRLKRAVAQLRRTVQPLARLGADYDALRMTEQARLQAPPEEVRAARFSPLLIKKLRTRLGLSQREMGLVIGVSTNTVGFWEQGKVRPAGRNKESLVALRKLGKRQVRQILAGKAPEPRKKTQRRPKSRNKRG